MNRGSTGSRASPIRKVTEARRNSAPGRARIRRQPIAQGRPGVFRPTCCPACAFACANSSRSGSWVPAGTRPSLRPLHLKRVKVRTKLGHCMPRECRSVRDLTQRMVLPDRIELSTSPLPMECSTTELRQHVLGSRIGRHEGPTKRADICHKPPSCASLQALPRRENRADIGAKMPVLARNDRLSVDSGSDFPTQLASWPGCRIRLILEFRTIGSRGPLELPRSLGMLSPIAAMDR